MDKVRVVITGVGAISAVGSSAAAMMESLYAGKSGVRRIQRFDPSDLTTQIAAEVVDFDPAQYMDRKDAKRADRYSQFAIAAAREAVAQARLLGSDVDPTRIAAQIVTGIGFLGAGAIIHYGTSVRGLTTAASLWVTASVGMACGAGMYVVGVAATVFVAISLGPLHALAERLRPRGGASLSPRRRPARNRCARSRWRKTTVEGGFRRGQGQDT